jgi:DNA-binding NarL/FixJ family response regulator
MEISAPIVPLRTLVVEDHKGFLDHICSALREQRDLEIVGEIQNGLEAVERAATLQPDLIILDIGLPGLNGLEAARRIRTLSPGAKIIFLTLESSPEIVNEAFRLGAWGYVLKATFARDLPGAVEALMNGKKFASKGVGGAHEYLLIPT